MVTIKKAILTTSHIESIYQAHEKAFCSLGECSSRPSCIYKNNSPFFLNFISFLEVKMRRCENFDGVLLATDTDSNQRLITTVRCKQWTCSYCAKQNAKQWRAKIIHHINEVGGDWSWFTLTAKGGKRTAKSTLANLRQAWDRLVKRIKRKFSDLDKLHYCRVYEQHKNGAYHLHCIISVHWDDIKIRKQRNGKEVKYSDWLAKTAKKLDIGYYTHADNFEGEHAGYIAGYVAKYMTKMSATMKAEVGRVRHIQTSQGWTKKEVDKKYKWEVHSAYFDKDFYHDTKNGLSVIDIQTGEKITTDTFLTRSYYPDFEPE